MAWLKQLEMAEHRGDLSRVGEGKRLINTINAHSYNMALKDGAFAEALMKGDVLIPDGASIVWACKMIPGCKSRPKERIAGWDLFEYEMQRVSSGSGERGARSDERGAGSDERGTGSAAAKPKVMFLGSSEEVLEKIRAKALTEYPNVDVITYSPPYKEHFTDEENRAMVKAVNDAKPDLLWIGMTAPKQEKWAYAHLGEMQIDCHVGTVGAVFDFFAGTVKRAPLWWQRHSLEWLYRLMKEPRRMWKRYIIGNALFVWNILTKEVICTKSSSNC